MSKFPIKIFENFKKAKKEKKRFKQNQDRWALNGYTLLKENNTFKITGKEITLSSFSPNLIFTSSAVLLNNEYNFSIDEPYIMIDIGFNIGITSLAFAQNNNIKQIYGYEPFGPTYQNGLENLKQNPLSAKKIKVYNFGLSDKECSLEIAYNKERIGSMSTIKDRFSNNFDFIEKVIVKNAADELRPIFEKHSEKIFLKIDCEGAEKEIIPCLNQAGLLKKTDVIIMEWHFEYPHTILKILNQNGFITFCTIEPEAKTGIIRAVNRNKWSVRDSNS